MLCTQCGSWSATENPYLVKALVRSYKSASDQRCPVHFARNLLPSRQAPQRHRLTVMTLPVHQVSRRARLFPPRSLRPGGVLHAIEAHAGELLDRFVLLGLRSGDGSHELAHRERIDELEDLDDETA